MLNLFLCRNLLQNMRKIEMVDLKGQYQNIKSEIDAGIQSVIDSAAFVKGGMVVEFQKKLQDYLGFRNVIPVGNGTDALMVSLMSLNLKSGDEVVVPDFTFIAAAEVVSLLGLKLVLADVDKETFCLSVDSLKKAISPRTKAIVPVHLFGQNADMESIMQIAKSNELYVVEDACQSIAAKYYFSDGTNVVSGGIGNIGCTSFFPSKNLGCYGDGGAVFTNDDDLAEKIRCLANHGMMVRYHNDLVGVNSRLDSIQAAVLGVKLSHFEEYLSARAKAAKYYLEHLSDVEEVILPKKNKKSDHTWHQFTIRVKNGRRDALQQYLKSKEIPSMIYYPIPIHQQKAYQRSRIVEGGLPNSEQLCKEVLSLPMHTELDEEQLSYIVENIKEFFREKKVE